VATAAVAAAAMLLAACSSGGGKANDGSTQSNGKPKAGGTLTIATDAPPTTFDPQVASNFGSFNVGFQVYEAPFAIDAKGNRVPSLALSSTQPDPLTYELTLRSGVKFQDGQPFTADDVVYSWQRAQDPKTGAPYALYFASIKSVTAVSPTKVEIKLSKPDAALLNQMVMPFFPIVSKSWTEGKSADQVATTMNGTGPYKLASYQTGQTVTLERNANYWDAPKPYIGKVVMNIIGAEGTRLAALRSGQAELAWFRDPRVFAQAKSAGFTSATDLATRELVVFINGLSGPLSDVRVRQALSLGLDRKALIQAGTAGTGVLSGVIPAGTYTGLSVKAEDLPNYQHDTSKAKELLQQAGASNLSIDLNFASDPAFAIDVPMVETMKSQLADIGVTLNLKKTPFASIIQQYLGGKLTGLTLIPNVKLPDPALYVGAAVPPAPPRKQIDDPQLQQMAADAQAEQDPAKRGAAYDAIAKQVAQNVDVLIPYSMPQRFEAWSSKLVNYVTDPDTERVFLKNAWLG
jgi:peptide/nickel transport system substrate-binding protein